MPFRSSSLLGEWVLQDSLPNDNAESHNLLGIIYHAANRRTIIRMDIADTDWVVLMIWSS